jgi:hypothetical protein
MRHNSVSDVDGEVVGRVACALLRHEDEVPRTIVGRSRVCGRCQGNKTDDCRRAKQKLFHSDLSEALANWRASLWKRTDEMGATRNHFKGLNGRSDHGSVRAK